MDDLYETDVIAWAAQQVALLRSGQFALIDVENIAEEIEAVARSEKHELRSRLAVLLGHLLRWQYQQIRRGRGWRKTIKVQRVSIERDLAACPSLRPLLHDADWMQGVYERALHDTTIETGIAELPDTLPWDAEQILSAEFLPD